MSPCRWISVLAMPLHPKRRWSSIQRSWTSLRHVFRPTRRDGRVRETASYGALGIPNGRMKDFYDVWTMSQEFGFDGGSWAGRFRRPLSVVKPDSRYGSARLDGRVCGQSCRGEAVGRIHQEDQAGRGRPSPSPDHHRSERLSHAALVGHGRRDGPQARWPPRGPWSRELLSS